MLLCFLLLLSSPLSAQSDPLESLTLEQRIAQMFIVNLYGAELTEAGRDFLTRYQPGGVVLLGENLGTPEFVTRLTNRYQQTITGAGGLPLFVGVDQEGGPISHLSDGFTAFPTPTLMTASGDNDFVNQIGAAMGMELRAVGVNLNLAPVADLETNPRNPIIVRRSFGSDPAMVSPILAAFIHGMQSTGVMATAKHFPGHGESDTDSHTGLPIIDLSRERLEAVELAPFRAAIAADVAAIMAAHIWYPALEPEPNTPASLSSRIITDLLRDEMGYDGLIMTDALDMDAIDTVYSYPDAAVKAVQAGVDLIIAAHISLESQAAAIQALIDAVENGTISEERINESARRILAAKERYGLLEWQPLDPDAVSQRLSLERHTAMVELLFQAGVTLAYDRNGHLPLNPSRKVAIVYLGTRYQIVETCGVYRSDIQWVGVSDSPSDEQIAAAQTAARLVDTVVVFTQNADQNPRQALLVNALPPEKTVAVALWSPYDWTTYPDVSAYVVTYSPLRPAVTAACGLLFGSVPARARLAITLPGMP
ncbi:MAG: glycoside hydrolase family 3 protein [Anaerolineae bacterium]|nr:glycoside hydrolase family 3 protein [Anaerolineae bacterium]